MATKSVTLGELCKALDVPTRSARYLLEHGHVPDGVRKHPSRGVPRRFDAGQAFWMAIAVYLNLAKVHATLAAQVADAAVYGLRTTTQNLGYEWTFQPGKGWFETSHRYCIDVAEATFVRLVHDAEPLGTGLKEGPWIRLDGQRIDHQPTPPLFVRVDLAALARTLQQIWPTTAKQAYDLSIQNAKTRAASRNNENVKPNNRRP